MDKRGLSAVVTTLLIILLAIVAIGIVWVVISSIVESGAGDVEIGQFTIDLGIKSAYIEDSNVIVGVRRSSGEGNVTGIRFIFSDGSDTTSVDKNVPLDQLEEKTFTFTDSEVGGISTVQEVSIAPLYVPSGDNQERIGDITDTETIGTSSGTGDDGDDGETNGDNGDTGGLTYDCGNGDCETDLGEDASNCPTDCYVPTSCNGTWDGQTDLDDGNECDGGANCLENCNCPIGYSGDNNGGCVLNPPVNNGTINSVWNDIYFDSHDLPKNTTVTNYIGYYVNFSDSAETSCFEITFADYISENDISYLRVSDAPPLGTPSINAGEKYYIWEAESCGY